METPWILWLSTHWLEIFGVLAGLAFVYFEIKEHLLLWPIGILSALVSMVVFMQAKIYADMGLQLYYLVISFYGWYFWVHGRSKNKMNLVIGYTPMKLWPVIILITFLIDLILNFVLTNFTDSPVPSLDALTTALSITGTWMLARKYIEQWYIWLLVNLLTVGLYINRAIFLYAFLYAVYFVLSMVGLKEWRRKMKLSR